MGSADDRRLTEANGKKANAVKEYANAEAVTLQDKEKTELQTKSKVYAVLRNQYKIGEEEEA